MKLDELKNKFGDKIEVSEDKFGEKWVRVPVDSLVDLLAFLKEQGFDHLSTITGVDTGEEILLMYHLAKFDDKGSDSVNVVTKVNRDDSLAPSILEVYPSALVYEREVYDLLGVKFEGHKGLKRILLPDDLPEGYHPLRKDFDPKKFEAV